MGCLIRLSSCAFMCAVCCLISKWLCDISCEETYTWYSGLWHGLFFVPNLLRHAAYKAEFYTAAYNVWWWIGTIISSLSWVSTFLGFGGSRSRDY